MTKRKLYSVSFGEGYGFLVAADCPVEAGFVALHHHMDSGGWDDALSKEKSRQACKACLIECPPRVVDENTRYDWGFTEAQWKRALEVDDVCVVATDCWDQIEIYNDFVEGDHERLF